MTRLPIVIRFLYTYPQPVTPKTGSAPWSNFNRYGWSIFARRQQQRRVTASFRRADGRSLHLRKATRPETELAEIYQALNLDPLPGGVQKTIV